MKHRLLLTSTVIGVTLGFAAEAHAAPTDAAGQNKLATAGAGASNSSSAGAAPNADDAAGAAATVAGGAVAARARDFSVLENKVTAVQSTPPLAKEHKAGDHNLELYGFIQLDAIQDFKRVNPNWDATLRPSRIPTVGGQFGSDGQSIFSVRQSRLVPKPPACWQASRTRRSLNLTSLVSAGEGQTTIRIRHAYVSWGAPCSGFFFSSSPSNTVTAHRGSRPTIERTFSRSQRRWAAQGVIEEPIFLVPHPHGPASLTSTMRSRDSAG